jgi:excisionase family DNA binding protein
MPDSSAQIPQLLTLAAVAKALCVSPHTVRAWTQKGRLRPIRLCRRLLFHPDEVIRFVSEFKVSEAAQPAHDS